MSEVTHAGQPVEPPTPRLLCVGKTSLCFSGRAPNQALGRGAEFEELSVQVGGVAAVAAGTAVELGLASTLACKVGADFVGQYLLGVLRAAGIEARGIIAADSRLSGLQVHMHTPEREFRGHSAGDVPQAQPDELDLNSLLGDASVLVVDGSEPRLQVALADRACKRGIPVIADIGGLVGELGTLISLANILVCSERVANELAPANTLSQCLSELQRLGPAAVVVTLGEQGVAGLQGNTFVQDGRHQVEFVDSGGAGGVFVGALSVALLSRLDFVSCIKFANAAAALSCEHLGPWAGIPNRSAIAQLLAGRSA